MNAVQAAAIFMPMVKALMLEAEGTGASGTAKREAVAEASAKLYRTLQASGGIKEIRGVPWELVAPILVPAADGLISVLAGMFNRLVGKVWSFVRRPEPAASPA